MREGVEKLIVVGIDLPTSRRAVELADEFDPVYAVVGIHPNSAKGYHPEMLGLVREMLHHPKVVALGEIGLDYYWDHATQAEQFLALRDQLQLAEETEKPVVFHCRDAYDDLLDILDKRDPHPWLLHCFSGTAEHARRAVALDCYFGVDGPITYPKAEDLRSIVRSLPRDRIVVETDSPYLTPAPHRGKPNRPAYTVWVNSGLASCLGIEREECARMTTENAERFFGI